MTGINIQTPWSELLINEVKSVETRSYHLPAKYVGEELALIETPGKYGQFKARIIGTIIFSHSFKYPDQKAWQDDHNRHCVETNDPIYSWKGNKPKYGWVVHSVTKFKNPVDISKRKGIIFTTGIKLKKEPIR
jgi:predicted transcriptional regulator